LTGAYALRITYFAIIGVSLLAVNVFAGGTITTRLEFKENVRQQEKMESTVSLPDTAFNDFVNRALLWTSTDVGGVQSRVRVLTVVSQAFYQFPDTVVEVLAQILYSGDVTKSIKATPPQFAEELGVPTDLEATASDVDAIPVAFSYWDDTLTLQPVPVKVDTIYFMVHVEHEVLAADGDSIRFSKSAYTEAAVYYCCVMILEAEGMYEEAAYYLKRYEMIRDRLRAIFRPRFDVLGLPQ